MKMFEHLAAANQGENQEQNEAIHTEAKRR